MAAVNVQLNVSGNSGFSANLAGAVHLSLGLAGASNFTASPLAKDGLIMALGGGSNFTAVALQRKPFVPGPVPGTAPPNPFPGLQVGRQPAARTSSPIVNPNPPRTLKPPEEPTR